jgi:signal transduction histidine kinase
VSLHEASVLRYDQTTVTPEPKGGGISARPHPGVRWLDRDGTRWGLALVVAGAMVALYVTGAQLGFKVGGFPWPFWPANGLVFAVLARRPARDWPLFAAAQVLGELLGGALVAAPLHAATVAYAFIDAGESWLAAWLVRRWAGPRLDLRSLRQVSLFLGVGLVAVLAAAGAATLVGLARGSRQPFRFLGTYAVGDFLGFLVVAPAVLRLLEGRRPAWSPRMARRAEAAGLGLLLVGVTMGGFLVPWPSGSYALVHAVIPVLAWCTLRLGTTGGSGGLLLVAVVGTVLTPLGFGPFALLAPGSASAFAAMQLFFAFVAATALLFGAAVAERRASAAALAQSARTEGVGALASVVAHDFGNFLTVILGGAESAGQALPVDHAAQAELETIAKAGRSASQLNRQLLALARTGGGRPEVVDLRLLVLDTERMARHLAGSQVRFTVHTPGEALPVLVDRVELERVIFNLVSNARGAVRPDGSIAIEVERAEPRSGAWPGGGHGAAALRVRDDGHGMDPRTLEHVFEPFFTTKEAGQGTGLGLAAVRELVKRARGTIEIASILGAGTTVSVLIPLADPEAGGPASSPGR